ncbi:MAG: VanZ family protein [bacterium]|nr:VanZ family protein [bacterium]
MRAFLYYHLPVIVYGAAILMVSSVPHLKSPELRILAADKVAHFLEYALFALLAYRSFSNLARKTKRNLTLLLSFGLLTVFALFDELLQSYTPGRFPDTMDYLFDLLGGTLVLLYLHWRQLRATVPPDR